MEVDINEVLSAINTLYVENIPQHDSSHVERVQRASDWLGNLQRSVHAWKVADQLLHLKNDIRSCFFAAQTLRTKIQYYFVELPEITHNDFRRSMMDHLSHIQEDTYHGITIQLCVAVADIALLMATWQDPYSDLVSEFGLAGTRCNLLPLLEVLIALPEEINSRYLRLGQARREEMNDYCKRQVPKLIQMLHTIISNDVLRPQHEVRVLRCLSSWFNLHCPDWAQLTNTCLLNYTLAVVSNPQMAPREHEIATDCVCAAMIMLEEVELPQLSQQLFAAVLQLEDAFHKAVAYEDLSAVTNYARMFAELGETLVPVVVSQPPPHIATEQVLSLLLMCVGHHEWEVAEITFNFWYKLSEVLYGKNDEELSARFKSHIERLLLALYRHCQIDVDHEGVLPDTDDFYEFRERVQDLIKDVVFICRSRACFAQMAELLRSPETQRGWHLSEAALFVMQSVARNLVPSDNLPCIEEVLREILHQPELPLPSDSGVVSGTGIHVQVVLTSLQLIAELNEWLASHPTLLPNVLAFCTSRLQHPQLATTAAKTLDAVCSTCQQFIEPHFSQLLHIVSNLNSFPVSNAAVVELLKGVINVMNRFDETAIEAHMEMLCTLQVAELELILQQGSPHMKGGSHEDPITWLDRLSAIFRNVNPSVSEGARHPCTQAALKVWPTIREVMLKYRQDIRVMEHCCRCLRHAVRCVRKDSAPILPTLVATIVSLYLESGHSCFVYLGSILVDEFGTEEGCVGGLIQMLEAFTPKTFAVLMQPNGFKENPDTVDDWYRLCTRFLQRCPVPFLQCPAMNTIIECGIQACLLDHKEANAAVLKFFQDLVVCGTKQPDAPDAELRRSLVSGFFEVHLQALVKSLITAVVYVLPPYMHHEVAETFLQLAVFDRARLNVALSDQLRELPRTNASGREAVTSEQVHELHHVITSASRVKEINKALQEFSRLFT